MRQFMKHPDLDAHIEAPESAVRIHEKAGWQVVDLADLPKTELLDIAERRGATTRKSAPKAEIAAAITSVQPEEG